MNIIAIEKTSEFSTTPEFVFPMAMGYDIFASQTCLLEVGKRLFVDTGICIRIPEGCYATISNRLSFQSIGVEVMPTTYPPSYNGPVKILIQNQGRHELPIITGDKIAVLVVLPIDPPTMIVHTPDHNSYQNQST